MDWYHECFRYFPNSSFLEALMGNNPSYSWRSLWSSGEIVKDGDSWRVGNVLSISVSKDPWLREKESAFIST